MLAVFGGYDYDLYVECRVCRAIIFETHGEITIADLMALEDNHVHGT